MFATASSGSLREIWRAKLDADSIDALNDYVLVVRPGLPETAEARGYDWLVARVDEVLGKRAQKPAPTAAGVVEAELESAA